jgi:hypothetical protein
MSASKSSYPNCPPRRGVPKSSTRGGGKRKVWVSLVEKTDGRMDLGRKQQFSWFKAPMYVEARLKKWGKM